MDTNMGDLYFAVPRRTLPVCIGWGRGGEYPAGEQEAEAEREQIAEALGVDQARAAPQAGQDE